MVNDRWVTDQELEDLKRAGVLVQSDREDSPEVEDLSKMEQDDSEGSDVDQSETSIFFARGSRTLLYSNSPRSSSTTSLSRLANGRIRLPSNILVANQLTPRRSLVGSKPDASFSIKRKKRAQSTASVPAETPQLESANDSIVFNPTPVPSAPQTPLVQSPAAEVKPEPFNFGPKKESTPVAEAPKPTFSFPTATPTAESKPAQPISFGTTVSTEIKPFSTTQAKPNPISFGGHPVSSQPSTPAAISPSPFKFGADSAKPATESPFKFGAEASKPLTSAPTFGFGAPPQQAPEAAATGFNFGAPKAPSPAPQATAPTFQFGSNPPASAQPPPNTFQFGAAPQATGFGVAVPGSPGAFGVDDYRTSAEAVE